MRFWRRSAKAADYPRVTHAVRVGPEPTVIHLPGVPKRPYTASSPDFTVRVARTEKGKLAITVTPKVDADKMAKAVADWAG